jgi:hypothetical protein
MGRRKKNSKNPSVANKNAPVSSSESHGMRNTLVGIAAGVVIAVLAAWITPLPGYVKSHWLPSPKASAAPPPVVIAVRKENLPCSGAWMVRKPLSELPKTPPQEADWTSWVKASGAADADSTHATVTIQGRSGQVVYLTGIRFHVKRNPPMRGIMVGPACGGEVTGRWVEVSLDSNPARIIKSSSDPRAALIGVSPVNYKPLSFPYEISAKDGLVLIIWGDAKKYDDVWSADILWSSQGVNGIAHINNNGIPFETTPSSYQTDSVYCVGCKDPHG